MDYTDIIIAPVITEKSSFLSAENKYVFKVNKNANKYQIKKAIEDAFNVKVTNVNTIMTKPKTKRVGKYSGKTSVYKKAMVTLAEGNTIEL